MLQTSFSCSLNPNPQLPLQTNLTRTSSSSLPRFSSPLRTIRRRSPLILSCTSFGNIGTTNDYQTRPVIRWKEIYNRVWSLENQDSGVSGVLNQCEIDGKTFQKSELFMFVKNLRKFCRYKLALEVFEWMSNRPERFESLNTSDIAIKLDLIAKVYGIQCAEDFFTRMPGHQKDRRLYGALLNAYVEVSEKDRAEKLLEKMKIEGYASFPLPFNRMMTMYMKLKDYNKIELLISEMKRSNIRLDLYSYNIWLYARGSQGSVTGLEEVYEELIQDPVVAPNWSTFSSMATLYLTLEQPEKAKECMNSLEKTFDGENRSPYHYLLNLYGRLGEKEEVYRVWRIYKSQFQTMTNWGYHSVIHSLVQVGDIEGAENFYNEWLSVKSTYDARISNILLGWYVKEGYFEKVESFFTHIEKAGGKVIASTWEIVAEYHIKQRRIYDALASFRQAKGTGYWKPRSAKVSAFLTLCEEEGDEVSKEEMMDLLRSLVSEHVAVDGGKYTHTSDSDVEIGWSGNKESEVLLSAI